MKTSIILCLALAVLLPPASGRAQDLKKLIDQLRSDQIDLRNEARRKLKEAGPRARPELERAAKDTDPNVAATCRELLRVLATADPWTS